MTASSDELRAGYRDPRVWFWMAFWPLALLVRVALGDYHTGPMILWALGIGLLETNAVLTGRRARRGLTLTPDGITWHKHEMFLPWSAVTTVERSDTRLVVRVSEPGDALEGMAQAARLEIRANLRRYGAPVALRAGRLDVPVDEVVAAARRLRGERPVTGSFERFVTLGARPDRARAHRFARLWTRLAAGGLGMVLFAAVVHGIFAVPGRDPQLVFVYKRIARPGYIDQLLTIVNTQGSTVAPTLEFLPLDRHGKRIPGVTVRTAFGTDRGMVVIPAYGNGNDVLAFDGPGARQVADVKVKVRRTVRIEAKVPAEAAEELTVRRIADGHTLPDVTGAFDTVLVTNSYRVPISVRLVCLLWEDPPPGAPQQLVASLPIGGLTRIDPLQVGTVPVTGPATGRTRECGSVKVFFSR